MSATARGCQGLSTGGGSGLMPGRDGLYARPVAQETIANDPLVPRRGLARAHHEALVEMGLLQGERVELLEGALVEVVPQGDPHSRTLRALNRWLVDLVTREVVVHTAPGDVGYGCVARLPWTTPLSVLGVPVDPASLLRA